MGFKIRTATLQDLEAIYQIEKVCFDSSDVFHEETFEFFLRKTGVFFLLAVKSEKNRDGTDLVVGFIIAQPKSNSKFEIITLDVHPDWQNKGLGTMLLREIEGQVSMRIKNKKNGSEDFFIELVVYENNHSAKKLYTKMGYQILGKLHNYYSRDRDGLRMVKKITSKKSPL